MLRTMKNSNPISQIVRDRLADLGLSQIPDSAIAYIEERMADELRRFASNRITPRYVGLSLFKALARARANAANSDTRAAAIPMPPRA